LLNQKLLNLHIRKKFVKEYKTSEKVLQKIVENAVTKISTTMILILF